jgi:hypothetical protein
MLRVPGVPGNSIGGGFRRGAHGKFIHICLSQNNGSCLFQIHHGFCAEGGNETGEDAGCTGGFHILRTDIILHGHRNSRQGACQFAGINGRLHLPGPFQGPFLIQADIAVIVLFLFLNLCENCLNSVLTGTFLFLYFIGQLQGRTFQQAHVSLSFRLSYGGLPFSKHRPFLRAIPPYAVL